MFFLLSIEERIEEAYNNLSIGYVACSWKWVDPIVVIVMNFLTFHTIVTIYENVCILILYVRINSKDEPLFERLAGMFIIPVNGSNKPNRIVVSGYEHNAH